MAAFGSVLLFEAKEHLVLNEERLCGRRKKAIYNRFSNF